MGGSSKSNSTSVTTRSFRDTKTTNPFYTSTTTKKGETNTDFQKGTAGETAYNFVNDNISNLLNNYLNPSLEDTTTKAKLDLFNQQQQRNLENNIINPLARSNLIRSSQATNMYNNLSDQSADYAKELIADSHNDTWNMINNLMNMYLSAYSGTAGEQSNSINTSLGAGNSTTTSSGKAG